MSKEVRVCLVTGTRGAGKSTLIEHALKECRGIRPVAVRADLRVPGKLEDELTAICEEGRADYILLEADADCDQERLVETTAMVCEINSEDGIPMKLDNVVAVVDCPEAYRAFSEGRKLNRAPLDGPDTEYEVIGQLEMCSTVVFNKAEMLSDEELDELIATARLLQADAAMAVAENGAVDAAEILMTDRFDREHIMRGAGWVNVLQNPEPVPEDDEEYGLMTFLYVRRQPFDHEKLVEMCDMWPHSVIRMKGMVWYSNEPDMSFMLEQAGRAITESPSGKFLAAAPVETQLELLGKYPEIRKIWDRKYKDRMIKLAFIGKNTDIELLTMRLDACLGDLPDRES
ncbi:MAG: GTP-binding protein [Lachnospiraceae bacterium]|nr:GTP-binding protein [Lachnospiraceae bacterium]